MTLFVIDLAYYFFNSTLISTLTKHLLYERYWEFLNDVTTATTTTTSSTTTPSNYYSLNAYSTQSSVLSTSPLSQLIYIWILWGNYLYTHSTSEHYEAINCTPITDTDTVVLSTVQAGPWNMSQKEWYWDWDKGLEEVT